MEIEEMFGLLKKIHLQAKELNQNLSRIAEEFAVLNERLRREEENYQ